MSQQDVEKAVEFAEAAGQVVQKLKPGTYDAAAALALTSIAHSLAVMAAASVRD